MITLAIDCSASIMSVSLQKGDSLFESSIRDGFKNSENLMPLINSITKTAKVNPSEIQLIAVASGPGSFTGLRIAMSTAKGIAAGTGAAIVSVPTLDAYAMGYNFFEGIVIPVIDARKKRFYCSIYKKGKPIEKNLDISAEALLKISEKYKKILITGPDSQLFSSYSDKDSRIIIDSHFTSTASSDVLTLGKKIFEQDGPDLSGAGPVYIRKSEAEISMFGE